MSIYASGWTPRGVRKDWDRCSIDNYSAQSAFGPWVKGKVIDACAWLDRNDVLRVLVADTDTGHRVTRRNTAKSVTITAERHGRPSWTRSPTASALQRRSA